jgi:hypothetical protein
MICEVDLPCVTSESGRDKWVYEDFEENIEAQILNVKKEEENDYVIVNRCLLCFLSSYSHHFF